jgi:hypothetical protein
MRAEKVLKIMQQSKQQCMGWTMDFVPCPRADVATVPRVESIDYRFDDEKKLLSWGDILVSLRS